MWPILQRKCNISVLIVKRRVDVYISGHILLGEGGIIAVAANWLITSPTLRFADAWDCS